MKHEMPHDLSPELAKKAAEKAFETYLDRYGKYNPSLRWVSDTRAKASFSAKGISLSGEIELKPRSIVFDLDVPFLFRPFKHKAIEIMERELAHWTSKARNGEL